MIEKFNYFSYSDLFWIRFNPHLIAFGFKGLPEDVHFTIGFDGRSPDINIHLTKNTTDNKDKPHIKIVVINKELLKEEVMNIFHSIFRYFFKPLNIDDLGSDDVKFISFNDILGDETSSIIETEFINFLLSNSKIKQKKKVKLNEGLDSKLMELSSSESFQEPLISKMVDFQLASDKSKEGGLIICNEEVITALKINEHWYSISKNFEPIDFLYHLLGKQLTRDIKWKTKRALVNIKSASTYSDTDHLNKPIRLVRKKMV